MRSPWRVRWSVFGCVLMSVVLAEAGYPVTDVVDAAKRGDVHAVHRLVADTPETVASRDEGGYTALHWAAIRAQWRIFSELLAAGAPMLLVVSEIDLDAILAMVEKHRPDVLVIDDIQFLAGKESTQEEFFHTFNTLYNDKKQIVLTSDRSPKEITTLEERLRSRFEWGLIVDIQPPNLETRIAILQRKVDIHSIGIPDDVIQYIAENITDNIRRLEGALIRLLAFASLTARDINLEMASEVLSSFFQGSSTGPVKIADVMKTVGEVHDVTVDQLKSKRRTQDLARARQIAMFLAREMTGASLNQIGRAFGGRDKVFFITGTLCSEKNGINPQLLGLAHADCLIRCGGGDKEKNIGFISLDLGQDGRIVFGAAHNGFIHDIGNPQIFQRLDGFFGQIFTIGDLFV